MVLFEIGSPHWHEVIDPAQAGRRVLLVNNRPTLLGVWARRLREAAILARATQQSDYAAKWAGSAPPGAVCEASRRYQRASFSHWLRGLTRWFKPRYSRKYYKRVEL